MLGAMSERRTFVPKGRDLIGMVSERRLNFCSCHMAQIKLILGIFSEDVLNLHQCSFVWDVTLGGKIQDVKPQV